MLAESLRALTGSRLLKPPVRKQRPDAAGSAERDRRRKVWCVMRLFRRTAPDPHKTKTSAEQGGISFSIDVTQISNGFHARKRVRYSVFHRN